MTKLNPAFPTFDLVSLLESPNEVVDALMQKGACYIAGYEDRLESIAKEFDSLALNADAAVNVLSPKDAKRNFPSIYNTLYGSEFKIIKRKLFGMVYKDEIEIFCQHTGVSTAPPSGVLHFDKRFTFKSWYYLNDVGVDEGAMRVVPLDRCKGDFSPVELRKKFGTRKLFRGSGDRHQVSVGSLSILEDASEYVTGPKGTLFLHITEAWHGASPVIAGAERKIIRAHSRAFFDYFLR